METGGFDSAALEAVPFLLGTQDFGHPLQKGIIERLAVRGPKFFEVGQYQAFLVLLIKSSVHNVGRTIIGCLSHTSGDEQIGPSPFD